MERLSGLDSSFVTFETPTTHMHVLGVAVLDPSTMPGGYSYERIYHLISSRAPTVPGLRRRLAPVPLSVSHPYWVEDADFDLDYHVRRIAVPAPGGDRELADVVGGIASRPLNRSMPLWQLWVLEGLEDGHVALVAKMHHATVDGVTGANLLVYLFDLEPEPAAPPALADDWKPERKPSDVELLARGLLGTTRLPFALAKLLPTTAVRVGRLVARRRGPDIGMPAPFTAPRTPFNGAITPHRTVAFTDVALEDVKKIRRAFGVKVNDVVLAVAGGALRRFLADQDALPDKSLIAVIPMSVHARTADKRGVNKISFLFATLATDLEDPVARLRLIAETNEGAKQEHALMGADLLQDWAEHAAPATFSLAARMYSNLQLAHRHPVVHNLIVSNVPGPPMPLYLAGARLVSLALFGPVYDGAGLNLTVVSYQDRVGFGAIACRELVPDLSRLIDFVPEALAELVKLADATVPQ